MPSELVKLAKKIAKRDKEFFDSLIEFETTKKLETKARLNFTIDKSIASRFRKYCRSKGYNMSAKLERAMEKIIEEN